MIGLNTTHQKILFRLRGLLLWRQFTGEKGRIVTALMVLFVFAPLAAGITIGSVIGYFQLPDDWPGQLLGGLLFLMWLFWAAAPIFLGAINVSVNVSRLLIFPITRRDMIAAILLGTLLDYPTLLILPLFVGILIGWLATPAWPFVLLGLPIAYLHMIVIGQIIMVGASRILQSRRFRDLMLIVVSLLGASCYFITQGITEFLERVVDPDAAEAFFATWRPLNLLQWFPTGAIGRAIEAGARSAWGSASLWLAYSIVLLLVLGWLWSFLLDRLLTGQTMVLSRAEEAPIRSQKRPGRGWQAMIDWLPDPLSSLVRKELLLIWRIPQRRIGIIQTFLLPVIFGGLYFFSGDFGDGFDGRWIGLILIGYSYLPTLGFAANVLAWEGNGLSMLFVTPLDRRTMVWGKSVTAILLSSLPLVFFAVPLLFFTRPLPLLAGLFTAVGLIGVGTTVSVLFSVWFPFPVNMDPKRPFAQPERRGGFLPTLMAVIGTPLLTGALGLPLALPIFLVWWLEWEVIGLLTAVLAAAYGLLVAWYGAGPIAEQLLQREPDIIDALRTPEGD